MRRREVHAAFAAATLALAAVAAWQAIALAGAVRVADAIARGADVAPADRDRPEARLARLVALSARGRHDDALAEGRTLLAQGPASMAPDVLYDLGNDHLRRALATPATDPAARLPWVELAKQRYRDALRLDPPDWDARFNLERALSLAPEIEDEAADAAEPAVNKERTATTAPVGRSALP